MLGHQQIGAFRRGGSRDRQGRGRRIRAASASTLPTARTCRTVIHSSSSCSSPTPSPWRRSSVTPTRSIEPLPTALARRDSQRRPTGIQRHRRPRPGPDPAGPADPRAILSARRRPAPPAVRAGDNVVGVTELRSMTCCHRCRRPGSRWHPHRLPMGTIRHRRRPRRPARSTGTEVLVAPPRPGPPRPVLSGRRRRSPADGARSCSCLAVLHGGCASTRARRDHCIRRRCARGGSMTWPRTSAPTAAGMRIESKGLSHHVPLPHPGRIWRTGSGRGR